MESEKLPNHRAAIAMAYVHYNLCHVVSTLRVTPAMAVGATDHVWELRELLDALLSEAPCDVPTKQPLASRTPETTHRELPTGRGFLRVIDGGKGKSPEAPKVPPTPPEPVRYAAPVIEDPEQRWRDMDVKLWKLQEKRMDFFGDDGSDDCPY